MVLSRKKQIVIVSIIAFTSAFTSCNKIGIPHVPPIPDTTITVTINQTLPSIPVPANFQGLSFETSTLTNVSSFLNTKNTNLINLISNMGGGVLRIGGNSSDAITWNNAIRSTKTPANSITQTEINTLSLFSSKIGWKVLMGLNLGIFDTAAAASEAKYVYNKLQNNLLSVQFGNEPDGYHSWNPLRATSYGYSNYKTEWESYYKAVKAQTPLVPVAGPDVAYQSSWVAAFATNEKSKVQFLDSHYYQNGPATNTSLTVDSLFTPIPQYPNYFTIINNAAVAAKLPWRISECNSINGGGATGISNVFGSALWALDFMWTIAENNGAGINFHGGSGGAYSPFYVSGGLTYAQPIYYSFLAFNYGATGDTILPTTINTTKFNCSAYSSTKKGTTYVTLINKNEKQDLIFKLQLTNKVASAQVARLKAPSMMATTGVTFCGNAVNSNGTYQTGTTENIIVGGLNYFGVLVPAASAAVVSITNTAY